jgi:hypothetical protein
MHGSHGSSSTLPASTLSIGQFVLMSIAVLSASSAFMVQRLALPQFEKSVRLDLSSLDWLGQIKFGFEQVAVPAEAPVAPSSLIKPLEEVNAQTKGQKSKSSGKSLAESPSRPRAKFSAHRKPLKRFSVLAFATKKVLGNVPSDHNRVVPGEVDSIERGKLVVMHQFLTARLMIALNTPVMHVADLHGVTAPSDEVMQVKKIGVDTLIVTAASSERPLTTHKTMKKADRKIASVGRITYEPADSESNDSPKNGSNKIDAAVKSAQEWNQLITDDFRQIAQNTQAQVPTAESILNSPQSTAKVSDLAPELDSLYWTQMTSTYKSMGAPEASISLAQAAASNNSDLDIQKLNLAVASLNTSATVPTPVTTQVAVAQNGATQMTTAMAAAFPPFVLPTPSTKIDYSANKIKLSDRVLVTQSKTSALVADTQHDPAASAPSSERAAEDNLVEAFDAKQTSIPGSSQAISAESVDADETIKRGWNLSLSASADHWPTLNWFDPSVDAKQFIPLLHNNTVKSFETARLGNIVQQAGAGIVFGKIASGWQVEFAEEDIIGRKSPLFLDSQALIMGNEDVDAERYFVYLNVNPGSRVVYLNSRHGGGSGGVALPVMAGTATYLDLSKISVDKKVSGILYDEVHTAEEPLWPLAGATVRVIGQASAVVVTDSNGGFEANHLVTAASYPIYIESDKLVETDMGENKRSGFTHRYRILQKEMENLKLYRISRSQVKGWLKQLSGPINQETGIEEPISKESGIVVASLSQMIDSHPDLNLFPSVRAIPSSSSLVPETYTLSSSGQLEVLAPLQSTEPRFIGVQVPEGPVVTQVTDQGRNVIWSELTFASPGVINMIGPY